MNIWLIIFFFYKTGMADVPSTFPRENFYNYSTEESESDACDGKCLLRTNAFGEAKTSRHNRPPRSKRLLEKREKIATRKSKCILQMHEAKKKTGQGKYKYSAEICRV